MFCAKVRLLSFILACSVVAPIPAWSARFIDTSSSWTEKYINRLSDKGVISAADDGKFLPDKPVTRAQLSAWLVKVLGIENQSTPATSSFPDVKPGDWFFKPVEIIRQNNYISGYADGFRPNQFIQRAEVMVIISRTLNMPELDADRVAAELAKYSDGNKVPAWAKQGVAQCSAAGICVDDGNPKLLNPTAIATRGQTAALLSKLDEYEARQSIAQADKSAKPLQPETAGTAPVAGAAQPAANGDTASATNTSSQTAMNAQVSRDLFNPAAAQSQPASAPTGTALAAAQPAVAPTQPAASPTQTAEANESTQVPYAQPQFVSQQPQNELQQPQYMPQQSQYAPAYNQARPTYLQGAVSTMAAGTDLNAHLARTIDSSSARKGDTVTATVYEPIYVNGQMVLPSGTRFEGLITYARSAKRFRAGENGKIDIKFIFVDLPDGRRYPISASVDGKRIHLAGGTAAGRVGKTLAATGIGAGAGAIGGTTFGALAGIVDNNMGGSLLAGALVGTTIGAAAGTIVGVVRKGSDVQLPAGTAVPIRLESPLTITAPSYGGGYGRQAMYSQSQYAPSAYAQPPPAPYNGRR